jgi:hypothetical protein
MHGWASSRIRKVELVLVLVALLMLLLVLLLLLLLLLLMKVVLGGPAMIRVQWSFLTGENETERNERD